MTLDLFRLPGAGNAATGGGEDGASATGDGPGATTGTLAGIARHARPKAPIETLDAVDVSVSHGIAGDHRGFVKPGGHGRRQVTLMERRDWDAATAAVACRVPWYERRCNLLVDDLDLPQIAGTRLHIAELVLEITRETDPCLRMDALAPGLKAALSLDWRGGVCTRVIRGGRIAVGDRIRVG